MEHATLRNQIKETNTLLERLERDLAANPQRTSLTLGDRIPQPQTRQA